MTNKYVHNCRFVHHAKFHCIMTLLNKLFKVEFERGETGKEPFFELTSSLFLGSNENSVQKWPVKKSKIVWRTEYTEHKYSHNKKNWVFHTQ